MLLVVKTLLSASFKNAAFTSKIDCQRWWCWSLQHSRLLHHSFNCQLINMVSKLQMPANQKLPVAQDPEVCFIFMQVFRGHTLKFKQIFVRNWSRQNISKQLITSQSIIKSYTCNDDLINDHTPICSTSYNDQLFTSLSYSLPFLSLELAFL